MTPRLAGFLAVSLCLLSAGGGWAAAGPLPLRRIQETTDPGRVTVRVRAAERSPYPIPASLTGKFAEHLGANIVNGMDAQILRNPTFADFPFATGEMSPDGVVKFLIEEDKIARELRRRAANWGWPEPELDGLVAARADGLACFWTRTGPRGDVQVSPDTGPGGGRAQRVQVKATGQGIAQWTYLPLHRVRKYDFEIFARSPDIRSLSVSLTAPDAAKPCATASVTGLSRQWQKFTGSLDVPADLPADVACRLTLTADAPGQFVVRHVFLRPADHLTGADPDVVRFLKESRLPLLRWPGGNFVSGYHWEDGVGPVERRPTRPNYAWGEVEPNLFGTDEFIAFCRAVGCEPMICVNAGSGTPGEAARWIEYCNGAATTPMGARRAANGHSEPYGVKHWEVGNELWGRFQYHWTTPTGNADRYREFSEAMLAADPSIALYGCGATVMWGKSWNDALIAGAAPALRAITDHPLIGGDAPPATDPLDVYRDFMAVPEVLEQKWAALRGDMRRAGIAEPRLAITELQMFAHIARARDTNAPVRLTQANLVRPASHAEGLYDVLLYHAAVRLAPFVEMITHSAVVNHGGGLRKERERVYANPCHYAQAAFAAFAGATPVAVELETAMERAPRVLPQLRDATPNVAFGMADALAAVAPDGSLLVSVVHRGAARPVRLTVELKDFRPAAAAEVHTLTADVPWAVNSLTAPQAVKPEVSTVAVSSGRIELDLPPYTVLRLRVPPAP